MYTAPPDPNYAPRPPLEFGLVILVALLFIAGISTVATLIGRHRRRANPPYVRRRASAPCMVDLEQQARITIGTDTGNGKNGSRILAFPPLAVFAGPLGFGSTGYGKLALELPPSVLAVGRSSRLRDSVFCKALGKLNYPGLGGDKNAEKNSRRIVDIEAAAADKVTPPRNTIPIAVDVSLALPAWVRPHLAEICDPSQRLWTLTPMPTSPTLPEIIIQSCDDALIPASPASTCSTDSDASSAPSELDTPPPMTPTLASPVGVYFPASTPFSEREYLQVPSPSFRATREEEKPVLRNVSNFSGKTFALATPPGGFSKMGKLKERRMLAKAQAAVTTPVHGEQHLLATTDVVQVVERCDTSPRISQRVDTIAAFAQPQSAAVAGLGLGLRLQLRSQLDFQGSLDQALAASCPSGNEAASGTSGTLSAVASLNLGDDLEAATATTDLALFSPDVDEGDSEVLFDADADDDAFAYTDACANAGPDAQVKVDDHVDAHGDVVVPASAGGDNGHKGLLARLAPLIDASDWPFIIGIASDSVHDHLRDILDETQEETLEDADTDADTGSSATTDLVLHQTEARRALIVTCAIALMAALNRASRFPPLVFARGVWRDVGPSFHTGPGAFSYLDVIGTLENIGLAFYLIVVTELGESSVILNFFVAMAQLVM